MVIPDELRRVLARKPTLWIGAGVSRQADPPLPTLWNLAAGLRDPPIAWDPLPVVEDPYELFDRGLRDRVFRRSELDDYLERQLRPAHRDPRPGRLHRHLAALADAGTFPFIVDTNYDLLLRRALQEAGVPHTHTVLEDNVRRPSDGCWYLSIHGDQNDWSRVILTSESYEAYARKYHILAQQLDLLLNRHSVLFVGCSMTDPHLLDWMLGLSDANREKLKTWVAIMGHGETERRFRQSYKNRSVAEILGDHVLPVEVPSFSLLPQWFEELSMPHCNRGNGRSAAERANRSVSAFVAYKWESEEHLAWVRRLAKDLRGRGVDAILDQWEVRYGDSFSEYMSKNLSGADVILFIATPGALSAAEAQAESASALTREVYLMNERRNSDGTRIVGILRSGSRLPKQLEDNRYIDFRDDDDYEASLEALVMDLHGMLGPPPIVPMEGSVLERILRERQGERIVNLRRRLWDTSQQAGDLLELPELSLLIREAGMPPGLPVSSGHFRVQAESIWTDSSLPDIQVQLRRLAWAVYPVRGDLNPPVLPEELREQIDKARRPLAKWWDNSMRIVNAAGGGPEDLGTQIDSGLHEVYWLSWLETALVRRTKGDGLGKYGLFQLGKWLESHST